MTIVVTDSVERERIRTELLANMLVEAGAGSGKTTSLVDRMVEHVRTGTAVECIAAVTFTRKAANELRERFQIGLEQALRDSQLDAGSHGRYCMALHELDRAFMGTIHSFCARILREHPLEAGLDPDFREVSGADAKALERGFWRRWTERETRSDSADIRALYAVGIDPTLLYESFTSVKKYPDVAFDSPQRPMPDVSEVRRLLEALLDTAAGLLPREKPDDGWDKLMELVRRLQRSRRMSDWNDPVTFCVEIEGITKGNCEIVQKRWSDDKNGKTAAKALGDAFLAFLQGPLCDTVRAWHEYRYPLVMAVLQRAALLRKVERRTL